MGGGRGEREWGREEEREGVSEAHFLVIIILSASIPVLSFVLMSESVDSQIAVLQSL